MKEYSTDSGTPLADTDPAAAAPAVTFDNIALDLIVTSRTNPRTSFDATKLQELAASVAASGVHQPILVRPLPADRLADTAFATDASQLLLTDWPHRDKNSRYPRPAYEIIAGERRYRASILAGKPSIPAMIRQLTDDQVLEAQLVENLQRDDLHPMEEAEGYRRLCEATGITKDEIGAKIGKSRSYVYQRLQLLELGQEGREAFRTGKFDASKALLLAGVADPKLQLKALKELTAEGYGGATMTVREFRDWLQQNVMLKLEHAPFDTQDMALIEAAGACGDCVKRTGVNRDIFAAFDSPDMCTDAKCYGQKATISLQRIKDAAAEKGMKVIAGVEAKKLKPYSYGDQIKGYTRLDEKMEGGSVAKLLGKDAPTPLLFVDPHTHKQIKVLPTEVVGELLKDKGVKVATDQRAQQNKQYEAQRRKEQLEARIEETWRARAAGQIVNQVRAGVINAFSAPVLRLLLEKLVDALAQDYDGAERFDRILPLWGLPASGDGDDPEDPIRRHIQAAADIELGPMLIAYLLSADIDYSPHVQSGKNTPAITQLAEETGVDVDAIAREVKAEIKAEEAAARKAEKEKAAAKPAKAASAPTPAGASARVAPEGSDVIEKGVAAAKKIRGRSAKLSEEEAKLGIADAMQGVEAGALAPADPAAAVFPNDRVRFKENLKSPGGKARKVSGREGTVDEGEEGSLFVRFGDKAHEVAIAEPGELELLQESVFGPGQAVRVSSAPGRLRKRARKWRGWTGQVTGSSPTIYPARVAYTVKLAGKTTEESFWPGELEAMQA